MFSLVRRMCRDLLWVTSMERCCKVWYIFNLSRVVYSVQGRFFFTNITISLSLGRINCSQPSRCARLL